jgi:hypothetical protein
MALLAHITGGGPLRGLELVTIKYKNSANGNIWGVGIKDGAVRVTTKYHKNVRQTGQGKVIYRYLLYEVGKLLVYYLWFASLF